MVAYRYGGARALVRLHERHMWEFWATWCEARDAQVRLPDTPDPHYASLDVLLHHALQASRGYLQWMCEQLELPDPGIDPAPPAERAREEAAAYLSHLLARWRTPLSGVEPEAFRDRTYPLRITATTVEAMLEHAVMHPIRHSFQLRNLLAEQQAPQQ
jgi:hypothetical protein